MSALDAAEVDPTAQPGQAPQTAAEPVGSAGSEGGAAPVAGPDDAGADTARQRAEDQQVDTVTGTGAENPTVPSP